MSYLKTIQETVLGFPFVARIRRNHGLEHAVLHLLAQRYPQRSMAGHSDANGFWLIGDIPTETVHDIVHEARDRLRAGEHHLAVHPNCGTNFVTAGVLAGTAAFLALFGADKRARDKLERLPLAATLATMALIVAQPLGLSIQKHITTSGEIGDLSVEEIIPTRRGHLASHRIITRS